MDKRKEAQFVGDDDAIALCAIRLACAAGACRVWAERQPESARALERDAAGYTSEAATWLGAMLERGATDNGRLPAPTRYTAGGRQGRA